MLYVSEYSYIFFPVFFLSRPIFYASFDLYFCIYPFQMGLGSYFMIKFLLFIVLFSLFWRGATSKFINPYKLVILFGPKGCGKTTYLTKLGVKAMRSGRLVYANFPLPGAVPIRAKDFEDAAFFPGSLVLVDEAALDWDNRAFGKFPPGTLAYFRLQRHYKNTVYLASQSYDVDKKLRDLADELWLFRRTFTVFSYGKRIVKRIVLTSPQMDGVSRISEELKFDSLLFAFWGSRTLTFIPRWASCFDSFATPKRGIIQRVSFLGTIVLDSLPRSWYSLVQNCIDFYRPYVVSLISATSTFFDKLNQEKHDHPSDEDISASKRYNFATFFHGPKPPPDV